MRKIGKNYVIISGLMLFGLAYVLLSRSQTSKRSNTWHVRDVQQDNSSLNHNVASQKANYSAAVMLWPHERVGKVGPKPTGDLKIVVGIPTIKRPRETEYLDQTLNSLLRNRLSFDKVVFVVYVADTDKKWRNAVADKIKMNYPEYISSGLIHIIHPLEHMYPDWGKEMKLTLGDPPHQVKWRSKQNFDQAYVMSYAYSLQPKYYLSVEDDVTTVENYLEIIYKHAESNWRDEIIIISYCKWGAIGKLFHVKMLPTIVQYLRALWNYKPLDWLFSDLLRIIACRYPPKNCDKDIDGIKIDFPRQLFEHHGKISSLNRNQLG